MYNKCVIGIDIGGTYSRIGAVALDGMLLHSEITSSRFIAEGTPDTAISNLAAYINAYIKKNVPQIILGVAVAFPATIDKKREILYSATNLGKNAKCRFDGLNIPGELQKYIDAPVFLGKDTDFLLYNDIHELNVDTDEIISGIYFGTGIGSCFMYHREIIYGNDGVAGEIGHLPISDNRRRCTCGERQGCCETIASGWRLEEICRESFPDTPVSELFLRHADTPELRNFVYDCARVIALAGNLLNSACTIIGGGIVNMKGFPKDLLRENVFSMLRHPLPRNTFQLLFSSSDQNAGILGAAQFLFQKLNLSSVLEAEQEEK